LDPDEFEPRADEDRYIIAESRLAEPLEFDVVRGTAGTKESVHCSWRAIQACDDPQNAFRNFEAFMTLRKISRSLLSGMEQPKSFSIGYINASEVFLGPEDTLTKLYKHRPKKVIIKVGRTKIAQRTPPLQLLQRLILQWVLLQRVPKKLWVQ
jgi:hypothetical protein